MHSTLALTGLLMGLAGGPHCAAMCGAACAGMGRAAAQQLGARKRSVLRWFQLGRLIGYSVLGALAAGSMQALGWLSTQSAAFRPVWTLLHAVVLVVGLVLLWRAEQPLTLTGFGRNIWHRVQTVATQLSLRPSGALLLGCLWALLPCGLLYAALMLAALSNSPWEGAGVMALFAIGSGVTLAIGPWIWLQLRRTGGAKISGAWGVRLSGLALAASAAWALWMDLAHNQAPWCLVP